MSASSNKSLRSLFEDMLERKKHYLNCQGGKDFENRIKARLAELGYDKIDKNDVDKNDFQRVKKAVLEAETGRDVPNPFKNFRRHYMYQPYGTQEYPDFLILEAARIIIIETKFSKGRKGHPVWNGGLPRPNGIYVFGALKRKDLTFWLGKDIASVKETKRLRGFYNKVIKERQEFNTDEMSGQAYGFTVSVRRTFDQTKKHNKEAITDFFTNPNRKKLEKKVLDHLSR